MSEPPRPDEPGRWRKVTRYFTVRIAARRSRCACGHHDIFPPQVIVLYGGGWFFAKCPEARHEWTISTRRGAIVARWNVYAWRWQPAPLPPRLVDVLRSMP